MEVTRRASFLSCLAAILLSVLPSGSTSVYLTAHAKEETRASASSNGGSGIYSLTATRSVDGVLITWQHDYETGNLGFNVYRLTGKGRVKLNRDVVPGSVFISSRQAALFPINSYAFLDRHGRQDSTYEVEAVSVEGELAVSPSVQTAPGAGFTPVEEVVVDTLRTAGETLSAQDEYAADAIVPEPSNGPIADQWDVVGQTALKIGIKRDGWYRVTHQQMAAAGFNPVIDVRNLRLFVDGREIRIRTSKGSGTFSSGDYFEFFGRGLDVATTDTRIHYLIAGTQAGKRIRGEMHTSSPSPATLPSSPPFGSPTSYFFPFIFRFLYGDESRAQTVEPRTTSSPAAEPEPIPSQPEPAPSNSAGLETADRIAPLPRPSVDIGVPTPSVAGTPGPIKNQESPQQVARTKPLEKKRRAKKRANKKRRKHAHAVNNSAGPRSFSYTVQRKDRRIYFLNLLNGETENYFGDVLTATPITQSINTPNPEPTADGPVKFEVALQGVGATPHQIEVRFNGLLLGTMNFFATDRLVRTFSVPVNSLNNGSNSVNFTTVGGGVALVDYTRVTYPHALRADSNSLRLALRPNHAVTISGFTGSNINLLDHTDPYNVKLSKPITESDGAGGFAIKIEHSPATLNTRLLNAFPEGQFETPATFALNEPSTLNRNTNSADLLIVAHKTLIPAAAPLVTLRQSQGLTVKVVDVEDVFDEFGFGTHGPKAIKDLLARATATWTKAPRYVILLGDASHDPRNYEGRGDLDFVPTKLLGATFNETASDDWFSDFNNDGLAEIPVGRLPARTLTDADLLISKIVSFSPAAVPQSALLVADDPTGYYFNFEHANDEVQSLLPSSMGVERVNRRTDPNARTNLINKFNSGQSLVNYTGHGNIDTWTGAQIFTNNDAARLFNAVSIVISQVYGGGGEAGATYRNDFVELFNRGGWPVNLAGWSIQHTSATGTTWGVTNLPNVVVPPGRYFLIQLAQGPGGTINLPAPDAVGTINLGEASGKVALVNTTATLTGSGCPLSPNVVDFVGYGGADCARGNAASALTTTTAALRGNNGCANTNVNMADFSTGPPAPRNSANAANLCINANSRLPFSFVVVMDCLNGYFQDPFLAGLSEVLMKSPNGGSVAVFASSGLTIPDGQHAMARQLYILLYGSQSIALGDAVKTAKAATTDIDVRNTWIFFGDPSMKIR